MTLGRVLVAMLVACSSREPASQTAPSVAPTASVIPATARQLVTGIIADWSSTTVMLQRWRRHEVPGSPTATRGGA